MATPSLDYCDNSRSLDNYFCGAAADETSPREKGERHRAYLDHYLDEAERRGRRNNVVLNSPREMSREGFEDDRSGLGRIIRKAKRAVEETADKIEDVVDDASE